MFTLMLLILTGCTLVIAAWWTMRPDLMAHSECTAGDDWNKRTCERAYAGDPEAQHLFGMMNDLGNGISPNKQEAEKWYKIAAEKGFAPDQYTLATMYWEGDGVVKDYAKAVKLLRLAADQGDELAQNKLGIAFYHGRGVPKDLILAHVWISLAASHGHDQVNWNLSDLENEMTHEQIEEAKKIRRDWLASH